MVNDMQADAALAYLVETDNVAAELKADVARAEYKLKAIRGALFAAMRGGTVADRSALVESSPELDAAAAAHIGAIAASGAVANRRATQILIVEVWRTVQANQRRGNI